MTNPRSISRLRAKIAPHLVEQAAKSLYALGFGFSRFTDGKNTIGIWRKSLRKSGSHEERRPGAFVMIPGFGDGPLTWTLTLAGTLPSISLDHDELVILDFPGFTGALGARLCVPDMDSLLAVTHAALDELAPKTLMGHSLGGWLSAAYAASEKGRKTVKNLVLVNAPGVIPSDEARDEYERQRADTAHAFGIRDFRSKLFSREPLLFQLFSADFEAFISRKEIVAFSHSIEERHTLNGSLDRIRARTLVLWGENDRLIPSESYLFWLKSLNAAEGRLIAGAGHGPHMEAPLQVIRAVGNFLSEDGAKGSPSTVITSLARRLPRLQLAFAWK